MSGFEALVHWSRNGAQFTDGRYNRGHTWQFDAGLQVPAASAPENAPRGCAPEAAVDPEEALVAALSSCHMLFFLHFAAKAGITVENYRDAASGVLKKTADGVIMMTKVTLRPEVTYAGTAPDPESEAALHHRSHEHCFIANSVKSEVVLEPLPSRTVEAPPA